MNTPVSYVPGGDQERATTRPEIEAEIVTLTSQQIQAVKDATFMGWEPAELAAHEERRIRLIWLRMRIAGLDAD
jgi:hypothetical protein